MREVLKDLKGLKIREVRVDSEFNPQLIEFVLSKKTNSRRVHVVQLLNGQCKNIPLRIYDIRKDRINKEENNEKDR